MGKGKNNKSQYKHRNSYYNNSNVAYDVEPVYSPKEKERPAANPNARPSKNDRAEKDSRIYHRIKLFCAVTFIFGCCILTMISFASVTEQKVKLTQMRNELTTLQSENNSLQAEITENIDLAKVETEATTRLGMSEPQSFQVVYIDVPSQSYTVQYDVTDKVTKNKFSLEGIKDFFRGI